jgi:hypothetical protein
MNYGISTFGPRPQYLQQTIESLRVGGIEPHVFEDKIGDHCKIKTESWQTLFAMDDAEYAGMFEDDIICSRNLAATVDLITTRFRPPVIALFTARRESTLHFKDGYCWLPDFSDQAMVIRRDTYQDYLSVVESGGAFMTQPYFDMPKNKWSHDRIWKYYLTYRGLPVFHTSPTVVEHVGEISAIGHAWKMFGREGRKSQAFLGADVDAFEYFSKLWQA